MALYQPDILQHNNPNLAISNSDFVKGGFRTGVATKNDLYALSGKTDLPSAAGQVKEHATIVYVSGETAYYVLVDIANIDNVAGWEIFNSGGGGAGTITGATNGLSITGGGTEIALGGDLNSDTTIDTSGNSLNITNIGDFQVSSGLSTIFGVNNEGLSFLFSGGSITYETNQGILYGGNYHVNYDNRSLVDKEYVDIIATGLDPKSAVAVTTTVADGNLDLSGLTSPATIDGITLVDGMRVLVKEQTDASENGIWVASASTWSRSTDFDGTPEGEVTQGAFIPVFTGDTLFNTIWILITPDPISIGVTDLNFTLLSSPADYIAGTGITINTNTISVDGASLVGNSLKWTGNTFNVDISGGTLGTALDSKLDISVFSGYTGTTQEALTGITADIQYISGITSGNTTSIENNYNEFTGYTATTEQTLTGITNDIQTNYDLFTGYTATTEQTLTGITSDIQTNYELFTGYTATTEPIISAALTGVTSAGTGTTLYSGATGLNGRNIVLNTIVGSGDTVIQKVGDEIQIYSSSGGVSNLTGATNGLSLFSGETYVGLGGALTIPTNILMSGTTSLIISDTRATTSGITYGGDYEDDFVPRSLVSKQYVDEAITGSSNTVNVHNVYTTYSATTENDFIGVSGATSIYLPPVPKPCQRITVVDIEGDAVTSPITVYGTGGHLINCALSASINTDFGSMTFINNNIWGWSAVAFIN